MKKHTLSKKQNVVKKNIFAIFPLHMYNEHTIHQTMG